MRNEIMFAGFGGQGVVKAALLLTVAGGLFENKEVAQTQSYGPEARGGACRSEVVISNEEIDYIKTIRLDALVVMSQPALEKYMDRIDKENTVVIADSTLITYKSSDNLKYFYPIEATRIAEEELGKALFANIIMLGALAGITQMVSIEALEKSLNGNVPEKTIEVNRSALRKGYDLGVSLKNIAKLRLKPTSR